MKRFVPTVVAMLMASTLSLMISLPTAYASHQAAKRVLQYRKAQGHGLVAVPTASRDQHPEIEATDIHGDTSTEGAKESHLEEEQKPTVAKTSSPKKEKTSSAANHEVDDDNEVGLDDLKAALAERIVSLPICRRDGSPEGKGEAEVTFFPDGSARVALSAPYIGTEAGACIARRLGGAGRPFAGSPPIRVRVRFAL